MIPYSSNFQVSLTGSVYTVIMVALERYFNICKPFRYSQKVSIFNCYYLLFLVLNQISFSYLLFVKVLKYLIFRVCCLQEKVILFSLLCFLYCTISTSLWNSKQFTLKFHSMKLPGNYTTHQHYPTSHIVQVCTLLCCDHLVALCCCLIYIR